MTVDVDATIHFGLKRNNNKKREIRAFASPYLTFLITMKNKKNYREKFILLHFIYSK